MNKLFVVATPIGNLEDITIRAIKKLLEVEVIACEDTRHTGNLIKIIKDRYANLVDSGQWAMQKKYISVRDWNEQEQIMKVLEELHNKDVAIVSDAGTPLISDPGYKLIKIVRAAGFEVVPIPGVSALTTALSAAGLPTNKVVFWGFYQEKYELDNKATNVFFENPIRLPKTLKEIQKKYPQSEIIIANELTKIHERFLTPEEIEQIKGEVTVLVNLEV